MRTGFLLSLLVLAAACRAEIIDRVAVTVGTRAILLSDVTREIRLNAFLNETAPDFSPASRKTAAERLVDRALAETEMEIGKYPPPEKPEIDAQFSSVRRQHSSGGERWDKAIAGAGITEADLRLYLRQQVALVRFVDARFGPGVQVSEEDLQAYYEGRFTREWQNRSKEPRPQFEEVRAGIEDVVRAQRVDALLNQWLEEARGRTRIEFKAEALE